MEEEIEEQEEDDEDDEDGDDDEDEDEMEMEEMGEDQEPDGEIRKLSDVQMRRQARVDWEPEAVLRQIGALPCTWRGNLSAAPQTEPTNGIQQNTMNRRLLTILSLASNGN